MKGVLLYCGRRLRGSRPIRLITESLSLSYLTGKLQVRSRLDKRAHLVWNPQDVLELDIFETVALEYHKSVELTGSAYN